VFLDFGTNVTSITAGQSVTFTAVLTDPAGSGTLVGGALSDQYGGTYGAFQASGGMGSFDLTISWAQMQQVHSIDFAYGTNAQRTFTAKFFDMAGNSAQTTTTITLTCSMGSVEWAAGAGVCYDTMNDPNNCGAVGNKCPAAVSCSEGHCVDFLACAPAQTSCDAMCAAAGKTCSDGCIKWLDPPLGIGGDAYTDAVCSLGPTKIQCADSLSGYKAARCCCF
jgi:hypothetical protein